MKRLIVILVIAMALGACTTNENNMVPEQTVLERYSAKLKKSYNLNVNTEGEVGRAQRICKKIRTIEEVEIGVSIYKQSFYHVIDVYDSENKFSFVTTENSLAVEICSDLGAF